MGLACYLSLNADMAAPDDSGAARYRHDCGHIGTKFMCINGQLAYAAHWPMPDEMTEMEIDMPNYSNVPANPSSVAVELWVEPTITILASSGSEASTVNGGDGLPFIGYTKS